MPTAIALRVLRSTSRPRLTLITCTPYRIDSHRLVVTAQLVSAT